MRKYLFTMIILSFVPLLWAQEEKKCEDDSLFLTIYMETDYQYNFSFGISYRFGSKSYPAVNPRFSY